MNEDNEDNDDNALNEYTRGQEIYSVSCIHCGKTLFKFSRNTLDFYDSGLGKIKLICPICNHLTTYYSNGTIE